ncbi:phytohormone-binding protein-like [Salvia miltiorrhiza]|uniref:phytohormone-binding protein-like n=1 Tax=Salvia miltiorrhiza TaxID=226208 RepID=UPI0025AD4381|nr:phytohormone-binding protein-like [Salvia miltiorrhiza]
MKKEETGEVKVRVGIERLWGALVNDLSSLLPVLIPNLVTEGEMLQGDGGLGTVYHFKFGPGVPNMRYQKEEVVELDESVHRIGLQVIEGGRLGLGFTYYKNSFQLTATGDSETRVDATVDYETELQETNVPAGESVKSGIAFIQELETFLLNQQPSNHSL